LKISIVITTYNRLSFLKRAIESALAQTKPCEIVVIDDCSTDGTLDYLESLATVVKFHRNSENIGHAESVNRGVNLAQGDWIKLLDDDDYLAPNCLEVISQAISKYPDAVIGSCQAIQVNEQQQEIKHTRRVGMEDTTYIPQEDIHYLMLLEHLPFGTPTQVMFSRQAFLESQGWNSHFNLAYDDIDSWVRISQFGAAVFVNQYLAYRTIWSGGHNQYFSIPERLISNIKIKEEIYDLVSEKYRDRLPPLNAIRNYLKLHWGFVALKKHQVVTCCRISHQACFSWQAWRLFFQAASQFTRQGNQDLDEME
jgi:glycosyltransferase involved in cell wall biosynthesis